MERTNYDTTTTETGRRDFSYRTGGNYDNLDQLYINGQWREGRSKNAIEVLNPYTEKEVFTFMPANREDVAEAYQAAASAQASWAQTPPTERRDIFLRAANIMEERKDEIIEWFIKGSGATFKSAQLEWILVHERMLEVATYPLRQTGEILPTGIPGKIGHVYRRPVGVVGTISPWDFSMQLANRTIAPAIALGNAVVHKAPSLTPVTGGSLLARIYEEAGLPPGVLNVMAGEPQDFGDAFVENPIPRVITFTGSTRIGRHIGEICGRTLKKCILELGGNSPLVVLDDADLDLAVNIAIAGKFIHSGQICMATNRIIVHEKIHDEFLERFTERVSSLKMGDPHDPETDLGPLISRKQFNYIRKLADDTVNAGARLIIDGPSKGLVMHPVVLADVTNDMPAAKNEIFGPIALIIKVKSESEALRIANDTEFGLSSAVCTQDVGRGLQFAHQVQAGMTHINDITVNDEPNSPFGGVKDSGFGRFGGEWDIREFTSEHWITIQTDTRQYPI